MSLGSLLWSCLVHFLDQVFDETGQTVAFVNTVYQEGTVSLLALAPKTQLN